MGPLRKNLGSRIPNAAASTNSANSDADVTLQSLAAAYQDLTARLSALEQLQLENARLLELTNTQANEIASLRAQLAAQSAGAPRDTPSSNTAASSSAAPNGAKETVSSPSLGTAASSWATVASRGTKNKHRRRTAAARGFQPVTGEQGFDYVYIPRSRKMTYTEARRRLGRLGVDNWRVLDVCFPAHSVVSLLVHLQCRLIRLLHLIECRLQDLKLWRQQVFLLFLFRCKTYLAGFKSWNKESPTMMQSEEIATLRAKLGSMTSSGHTGSDKIAKPVSQVGNVAAASAISAMEDALYNNVNPVPSGTETSSWAVMTANGKPRNKVRRRLAAARGFQPVSGDQGFEYV
ncbi:hypothetical protein G6F39_011148 [Rhizopus arrhizus]|nr:hypothetical protein G6F39_011148 [Rhizopus arrhizus]